MPLEWDQEFVLTSPQGTISFNDFLGTTNQQIVYLDPAKCSAAPELRSEKDDVPQADGSILHAQFKSGIEIRLGVELWRDADNPACAGDLVQMWDRLLLHLDALVNPTVADSEAGRCRLAFTPTGASQRLWDRIKLAEWPTPELSNGVWVAEFAFHCPYPYAISATEHSTNVSGAATIHNVGNTPHFPVFQIHGSAGEFDVFNTTSGLHFTYDQTLPGASVIAGGDYIEVVTFDSTVYLNGSGASRKSGIDVTQSDFFPLLPGANDISHDGDGTVTMLWHDAWVS